MTVEITLSAVLCEGCPCKRRKYEDENQCGLGFTVGHPDDFFEVVDYSCDCGLKSVSSSKGKYSPAFKEITIARFTAADSVYPEGELSRRDKRRNPSHAEYEKIFDLKKYQKKAIRKPQFPEDAMPILKLDSFKKMLYNHSEAKWPFDQRTPRLNKLKAQMVVAAKGLKKLKQRVEKMRKLYENKPA